MAVVTGPLHSSEARGSVGALQYNSWRGRATVRTRSGPPIGTQYTDARVALRVLTSNATSTWQGMTDAQRALWSVYANQHLDPSWTGTGQRITGYNWFVRINVRRQLIGQAIEETPPTDAVTCQCTDLWADSEDNFTYFTWHTCGPYNAATTWTVAYVTAAHSAGANPTLKQAKFRDYGLYNSLQLTFSLPSSLWYTAFLRPMLSSGVVGQWAFLKFYASP